MYPLRSLNVPLGVHVPQFGNPWTKAMIDQAKQKFNDFLKDKLKN